MVSYLLSVITSFIIRVISTLGYPGVALLMAIQTIAIPMPSEVIIPFAGFLAGTGRFNVWLIALAGASGSAIGGSIAYGIGYKGGRPLVEKYGRMILISQNDLNIADKFFSRFGYWAAFFGQLLPVVRSFISFPAGISRVPFKRFAMFTFLGSFIWCLVLGFVGMKLGENWSSLRDIFKKFDVVIVIVVVVFILWWIYRHVKNNKI